MNKFINFFKNSATFTTVLIITLIYIANAFIFEDGMGVVEIIITALTTLYFVWGFNLQFWKSKKNKIDKEE